MQIDFEDARTGDEVLLQPDVTYEIVQTLVCHDAEEGLVVTYRVKEEWQSRLSRRASRPERQRRNEEIRAAYAGGLTQREVADRFGLSQERVGQIVRGEA